MEWARNLASRARDFFSGGSNREEEEERQRQQQRQARQQQRQQQAQATRPVPYSGSPQPQNVPDATTPLRKAQPGMQSDYQNPLQQMQQQADEIEQGQRQPIQRDAPPEVQQDDGRGMLRKAGDTVQLSGRRVGTGIVQGVGGLYDLAGGGLSKATGGRLGGDGEGTSRVSDWATRTAEDLDQQAADRDVEGAYRALNVPMEIGSYFLPGGQGRLATRVPGVGRHLSSTADRLRKAGDAVVDATQESGRIMRTGARGVREFIDPRNLAMDVRLTGRYTGQDVARGNEITAEQMRDNLGMSLAGSTAIPLIRRGGQQLHKALSRGEDAPPIPGRVKADDVGRQGAEVAPGVRSTSLQKAIDDGPVPARNPSEVASPNQQLSQSDDIMADFGRSVDGDAPLQRATPEQMALDVDAPTPRPSEVVRPEVDAMGNPAVQSDVQVARQLADEGIIPSQPASQNYASEQAMQSGRQQAARQEVTRARQEIADNRVSDPEIRADLLENAPRRETTNLEQAEISGHARVNNLDDSQVLSTFDHRRTVNNPEDYYEGLAAVDRLHGIKQAADAAGDTATSRSAQDRIADVVTNLDNYASESGRGLRTVRTLYEDLPTPMKARFIENKFAKKMGAELNDPDRAHLHGLVEQSENFADTARGALNEVRQIQEGLSTGRIAGEANVNAARARMEELGRVIDDAEANQGDFLGQALEFMRGKSPGGGKISNLGEFGRSMMLSAPSGRMFDMQATGLTALDDAAANTISSLLGKATNRISGAGRTVDTLMSPRQILEGGRKGLSDLRKAFTGNERVTDLQQFERSINRGDLSGGGGVIKRTTRSAVMLPDAATRGMRDARVRQVGMQKGKQLGLKGDELQLYADTFQRLPDQQTVDRATLEWRKTNMMHDNVVTNKLEGMGRWLEGKWDNPAGRAVGGVVKNAVIPFSRFLGGAVHRTFTDKNVISNANQMRKALNRGDMQGFNDQLGKMINNTVQVTAAAAFLSNTGVITETDANGNSFDGLYLRFGEDRFVPVAWAGTFAPNIIVGYSFNRAIQDVADGQSFPDAFFNNLADFTSRSMARLDVSALLGGDNTLQRFGSDLYSAARYGDSDDPTRSYANAAARLAGSIAGQYIPSAFRDVNSVLDQTEMNPSGQAHETRATEFNPATGRERTNVPQTALNQLQSGIPGLSQGLDRRPDTVARNFVDRMTRGTRQSEEMGEQRESQESVDDMRRQLSIDGIRSDNNAITNYRESGEFENAIRAQEYNVAQAEARTDYPESKIQRERDKLTEIQLESEDVAVDNNGIKARIDRGDYDKAMRGLEYQFERAQRDEDTTQKQLDNLQQDITRLEVTRDGQFPPEVVDLYGSVGVTEWRALGDPDSEIYDPDLYELLYAYDSAMVEAGVSRKGRGDQPKYTARSGRGGSGGGGRGRRMSTSIATQSFSGPAFSPQKAQSATFGTGGSPIPSVEPIIQFDPAERLRKISVTRGGRG